MSQDSSISADSGREAISFTGLVPEFSDCLLGKGVNRRKVTGCRRAAEHFLAWLKLSRMSLSSVDDAILRRFLDHDCTCSVPPFKYNRLHNREVPEFVQSVRAFVQFNEETGRTATPGEIDDNLRVLDLFLDRRRAEGYAESSIRYSRNGGRHLLFWLHHCRLRLEDLDEAALERFCGHDCLCGRPGVFDDCQRHGGGVGRLNGETRAFVRFLAAQGLCPKMRPQARRPSDGLDDCRAWLRRHRAASDSSVQSHIYRLLKVLPDAGARRYDVKCITNALRNHLGRVAPSYAKNLAGSVRMHIRYLASKGECDPEVAEALPRVAHWRLSTLPKYISPDEMEQVFESFDTTTDTGKRDRAIVMLLDRLGFRGPDVSNLELSDINWNDASLRVRSKSGIEADLPLPQDVGDALLDYILTGRPRVGERLASIQERFRFLLNRGLGFRILRMRATGALNQGETDMESEQTAAQPPVAVKRSAGEWRALVREFEASGETLRAWCAGRGFSPKTLANWRSRLRAGPEPAFVPVPDSAPSALEVELDLGGGAVLRLRRA